MKAIITLLFFTISVFLIAQNVNGTLSDEGHYKVLKVWGTHPERGYAEGYLLGDEIMDLAKNYFLASVFQNNAQSYEYVKSYFTSNFEIDSQYLDEAHGIINGIVDANVDIYSNILHRNLDYQDILLSSSITDVSAIYNLNINLGCCSLSSWGESTSSDPQLQRNLLITRHMDWTPHPSLLANHLLKIEFPTEADETPWLSFTFPGFMGALSAINVAGLACFMDVGNNNLHPNSGPYHPILLTARNAIESTDYNADGMVSTADFILAIQDKNRVSGSLFHVLADNTALIVECNNQNGVAVRTLEDNALSPAINGTNLVLTNHFRKLYDPTYCYRYTDFADSLSSNSNITIDRSWELTSACGGVSGNIHKIQYIPSLDKVKWAVAQTNSPAYQCSAVDFVISDLFDYTSADINSLASTAIFLSAYPNPFNPSTTIAFEMDEDCQGVLTIYNIKGEQVVTLFEDKIQQNSKYEFIWNGLDKNSQKVSSGIYFCRLKTENEVFGKKILLLK